MLQTPDSAIISCPEGRVNGQAYARSMGPGARRSTRIATRSLIEEAATSSEGKTGMRNETMKFRRRLLAWYDQHRRELPWRANRDPYRVWLAEIMLQQTRVRAVIEHYHEFLRRFPRVESLAGAPGPPPPPACVCCGLYPS